MRKIRLRAVWLIVIPFLWFSRPTILSLPIGASLAALGLFIRAWSAGAIHKDQELTTTGPYAFTRNPLYVGSFFIGVGVSVAGGHWVWPALFLLFYACIYGRTMTGETSRLGELFPGAYERYAAEVPAFLPRLTPYRTSGGAGSGGFRWSQYKRNREWEAALGALAVFGLLTAKIVLR